MTNRTNRAPGRRVHRLAVSVGLTLFFILVGTGVASASWTTSPVGTTASVTSGTIGIKQAGFGSLAVQYSPTVTTATAPIIVTNTGTIPAPYTLTLSAPAANPLAQALVTTWPVLFASSCALPVPGTGSGTVSSTWAAGTTLTGSLDAGGAVVYCVSTSLTPTQVSANSAGSLVATLGLVSAVGNWSATDTAMATQSVFDTTAPTVPGTPAASGTTGVQTTLTWAASTDNVGVTGYEVYRGTTLVGTVTSTTFTDTGLTAGSTYNYTIKAKDVVGNGAISLPTSVTTLAPLDTTAPTPPGTPVASGTTGVQTTLTWAASTDNVGVTGYEVYRGGALITTVTSTTFTDAGLTPGTTYSYTIKAKDAAGNGSVSSATVVTTLDTIPPTAPGAPIASGTTDVQTTLTWAASTDNVGVTGYEVYRGATLVGTVTSTTFTDTGLTQGTTYSYTIKAKDAAGNGSVSGATVVTTTDTAPPTVPGTPVASGTTGVQTTLTWVASTDNVGVTGYEVYRGSTLVGTVTSTTFTDTGLTQGTTYSYTIKAKDAAGNGSVSGATAVTTLDTTPPTVPGTPVVSGTTGTQATLTWAASTDNVGVTGYEVYRGTSLIATVTSATFTDTGLTAGTTYSYTIKAKDAAGNRSAASSATNVITLALTPTTAYKIKPINNSGLCLDGSSNPPANGTALVTTTCNGNSQPWDVVLISGSYYYKIIHPTKSFAWEIAGSSLSDGAGAQFGTDTGAANQQWEVIQQSAGQYHFVNRTSGKCLEVPGASTVPGTQLQQRTCDGSTGQSFTVS
jgi:chitodextrinase